MKTNKKGRQPKPTTSIQRMIKVYAESMEQYNRWVDAARDANIPVSRYLREIIDSFIAGDWTTKETQQYEREILELQKQKSLLSNENAKLDGQLKRLEQNLKTAEKELYYVKYGSMLYENFEGERQLNKELITLFRNRKKLKDDDIATLLHLSPDEPKSNEIIMKQIEILQSYGLVIRKGGLYIWQN